MLVFGGALVVRGGTALVKIIENTSLLEIRLDAPHKTRSKQKPSQKSEPIVH